MRLSIDRRKAKTIDNTTDVINPEVSDDKISPVFAAKTDADNSFNSLSNCLENICFILTL